MASPWDDIIARLEKAVGPDRDLDTAIVLALHPQASIGLYCVGDMEPLVFHAEPLVPNKQELPRFTESFEAALCLLPQDKDYRLIHCDDENGGRSYEVTVYLVPFALAEESDARHARWCSATTSALAMCRAAFMARKALAEAPRG